MSKASEFIDHYRTLVEAAKVGNVVKLKKDVKSIDGYTILSKSLVEITSITKEGNNYRIEIESVDGERAVLTVKSLDKIGHDIL